jgi:hypothetical protein
MSLELLAVDIFSSATLSVYKQDHRLQKLATILLYSTLHLEHDLGNCQALFNLRSQNLQKTIRGIGP